MLRRDPGFTAVALLTLAIGISATATIFSLLDGVLLSPLPYPAPDRLVRIYESLPEVPTFPVRKHTLLSYRHDNRTLDGIAGFTRADLQLSLEDRPEALRGLQVSANYFTVLGMGPALGRGFTWAEERSDAGVVVISDALWRRRFDADPTVLGRQVRLSGRPFTVVGVVPERFEHVGGSYRSFPQGRKRRRLVAPASRGRQLAQRAQRALHERHRAAEARRHRGTGREPTWRGSRSARPRPTRTSGAFAPCRSSPTSSGPRPTASAC